MIEQNSEFFFEDLFHKYSKVIDIYMYKYSRAFFKCNIDKNDAYSECLLVFVKAINNSSY